MPARPVVHVHPTMPPSEGGAETVIEALMKHMRSMGIPSIGYARLIREHFDDFAPDMIGTDADPHTNPAMRREYLNGSARIIEAPASSVEFAIDPTNPMSKQERLSAITDFYLGEFETIRPSLVNVHNLQAPMVDLMTDGVVDAARALGVPTVFTVHNSNSSGSYFPRGYDKVVFMSQSTKSTFVAAGAPVNDAAVVTSGVDLGSFKPKGPADLEMKQLPGVKVFFLGRTADAQKGAEFAIEAFAQAMADPSLPEATLVLCGAGSDPRSENRKKVQALVDKAHRYLGELPTANARVAVVDAPHGKVPNLLRAADISVVPSQVDEGGWPLALVESVATGVPTVTTRGGGQAEALQFLYGEHAEAMIVDRNSPTGLAETLKALIKSPQLRAAVSSHGRRAEAQERIRVDRMADGFVSTYLSISSQFAKDVHAARAVELNQNNFGPDGLGLRSKDL